MKKNLLPLLTTIFNDALNYGIVVIIFAPMLIGKRAIFFQNYSIAARLSFVGFLFSIFPLGQLLTSPLFGAFADSIGRKKTIVLSLWGSVLANVLSAVGILFGSFWVLFISRFLAGGFSGNTSLAQAAIADMSTQENKSKNMSSVGLVGSIAWMLGVPLGGLLVGGNFSDSIRFSLPLWFASALFFVNVIWMITSFEETFIRKHSEARSFKEEFKDLSMFFHDRKLRYPLIYALLFYFGWFIYLLYYPTYFVRNFQFTATELGFLGSAIAVLFFMGSLFTKKVISTRWKPEKTIIIPTLGICLFFLPIGFIDNALLTIASFLCANFFGAILWIAIIALISNLAGTQHQGKAFGVMQFLQAVSVLIAPIFANLISVKYSSMPFYAMIVVFLIIAIIYYFFFQKNIRKVEK